MYYINRVLLVALMCLIGCDKSITPTVSQISQQSEFNHSSSSDVESSLVNQVNSSGGHLGSSINTLDLSSSGALQGGSVNHNKPSSTAMDLESSSSSNSFSDSQNTHASSSIDNSGSDYSYLKVGGTHIINNEGKVVQLRGINIGGWLVTENWMNGVTDANDAGGGRLSLESLEARFGEEKADTLIQAWRENFITVNDLDSIKSIGFNMIRVPFGYRNLQNKDGSWKRTNSGEIDFKWMDWIVAEAAKRELYVLFDYHIWKGQEQGMTDDASDAGKDFWNTAYEYISCGPEDETKSAQRGHAITLWKEVLQHYKGNATVAALELLNEACAGTWAAIFLYDALRELDPDRIFMIWGDPMEQTADWYNVMYGPHVYELTGPSFEDDKAKIDAHVVEIESLKVEYTVPYYTGEFHLFNNNADGHAKAQEYLLKRYAEHEISWSKWAYKGVDIGGWALVNYRGEARVDLANDSYDSILQTWQSLSSIQVFPNKTLFEQLKVAVGY